VTATQRQQKYAAKLRAEGLCLSCRRIYTPINPKTGRPFWYCRGCRVRLSDVCRQFYWQRKLDLGEASA
jgi:hypothetical protein